MKNNNDFILSSITDILKDVVSASAGIGSGIETYPLCDYIMQSVFLKMTGFQEQKMKCICWELATNDYEYRYDFTKTPLGECSQYKDKYKVYQDLIEQIKKNKSDFDILALNKNDILTTTISEIQNNFSNTNLSIWAQNSFNEFINNNNIQVEDFIVLKNAQSAETKLFENSLKDKYDVLYKHRNSCAHNTKSYQQNLPTLKILADENYKYENYFVWFTILILIDKVFIELYKEYLKTLEDKI
ncbi:MAG: hypothetical protein FWC10_06750 [Lentimicrobiaceae bacterium]|nr:hypothetical protein [Lentimicrobiaceae bacterium]